MSPLRKAWALAMLAAGWAVLLLSASPRACQATEESYVQVAQPAWDQDGLHITTTAYVDMIGTPVAGVSLRLITAENRMPVRTEFENRNAAFDRGMEVRIPYGWGFDNLQGDTMAVELDLSKLKQPDNPELIKVTVDCILLSSWYQRYGYVPNGPGAAKYVDLRVLGSKKYAHYARVYAFSKELPRLLPSLSDKYRYGHAF